jgi:hypothetical protein
VPSKEHSLVNIELVLLELYSVLLRLYPRQFRQNFAAEMQTVFGDALRCAQREGLWAIIRLCSREVGALPHALAREHWQSVIDKKAGMDKNIRFRPGMGDASPVLGETPTRSWGEIFAAMLPFLLILLVDTLPKLLVESGLLTWEAPWMQVVNITLVVLMIVALLATFFLAWRRKWPAWSATWYPIFVAAPLMLTGELLSLLIQGSRNFDVSQGLVWYIGVPLILAVLLYIVTRHHPLRGLLATLLVLYLLWLPNMEFVPDLIEVAIKIPSIVLICMAIAFLLRRGNWRTGLYAVLAMNLAVGGLFSFAGIYYGGTLPFVAPGPNLVEVARNLIPQYLAMGAILMGPLFAWRIRQAGRSSGLAGWAGYHLALAGLLLVILANLASLMRTMDSSSGSIASSSSTILMEAIVFGLGVYLLGLFFLYRGARFALKGPGWASRLLVMFLPLAIPATFMLPFITWKWPVSSLFGIPLLWALPQPLSLSIGLGWLALSVWVLTQGAEAAKPTAAVREASEASPLN